MTEDKEENAPLGAAKTLDRTAAPWAELIKDAERSFEIYQDKADKIDRLYANLENLSKGSTDREFQIFWANLEVLKPSIYARMPVPVVVPKFRNRAELPRMAADMLERTLSTALAVDDFDLTMKAVRDDLAINARGALWVRYEAAEKGGGIEERVAFDHVERRDFLHDPAHKWKEVEWVARRSWLSQAQGRARFGDDFLKAEFCEKAGQDDSYKGEKKAAVWEIWHKGQNVVVWISPGMAEVLDIQPPFLTLDGFFPCPQPAFGTRERGTLKPVPDFLYYKDQVEEINELTARISALAEGLRMKGFYAGGAEDLAAAIETAMKTQENNAMLIPIANFGALGGQAIRDSVVWLPIQEVAGTITSLIQLRRQLIDDVYQITGISDIMRGVTNASETLGAQELKSQYGSVRVRDRQLELVRLARDAISIAGEIMAENFEPETLVLMSQMGDLPRAQSVQQQMQATLAQLQQMQAQMQAAAADPQMQALAQANPQQAQATIAQAQGAMQQMQMQLQALQKLVTLEAIVQLLRAQRLRPFVLDIETDSTIQADEAGSKQRANEFIQAVGGFLGQALPMVSQLPESAPLATGMLKFVASQFRAGRELDGILEDFTRQVTERAAQGANPQAQAAQAHAAQQAQQQNIAFEMKKHQDELALKRETEQAKIAIEAQRLRHEMNKTNVAAGLPPDFNVEFDVLKTQQQMMQKQIGALVADKRQ